MALAKTLLSMLVILLLGFSSIIGVSNAIPITRTKSIMHGNYASIQASTNSHMEVVEVMPKKTFMERRKLADFELEDYPGSGANNRHTPRPQSKDCADC